MPAYERSTCGCWSCRIRKKKCDETYPICLACSSRGISCHGYGPKPEWMDGGEKERTVANTLKDEIKENLKQKRALDAVVFSQAPTAYGHYLSPKSTTASSLDNASPASAFTPPYQELACKDPLPPNPIAGECGSFDLSQRCEDHESTLLMNYLDHVFPMQFNCYVPTVIELGRGWLLALLTRTKPLFHAALAMSACYMCSMIQQSGRTRPRCIRGHEEAMKRHHTFAFQELQMQIAALDQGQGSLRQRIEILACITQLISFELLRGGTDYSIQLHMRAAASFIPCLTAARTAIEPSTKTISAAYIDRMDRGDFPPDVNEIANDFLVGVFLWFDIIATASTRSTPFLQDNFEYLGNIELEKVMGCENWVMILIAQISQLENWKRDMQKTGRLSVVELSNRGSEIAKLLNNGLASQNMPPATTTISRGPAQYSPLITRLFALSALTYLHVVLSGSYPELAEIKTSVSLAINTLTSLPAPHLLQNLVWPFCITGCMASRVYEQCLSDLVVAAGEDAMCPGNYWKAFEVIKECWRLRESRQDDGNGVDWVRAMDSLGFRALLV